MQGVPAMVGKDGGSQDALWQNQQLIQRMLDSHISRTEQVHSTLTSRIDKAIEISQGNAVAIAYIKQAVDTMTGSRETHISQLTDVASRVDALESVQDKREGERGVFSSLMNSNVVGWLAAAVVGLWSWLVHGTAAAGK